MDLPQLTEEMHRFVKEQGWYDPDSSKPQNARNLAASLVIESAEVLALYQWSEDPVKKKTLAGELADVALYLLQLASISGIDLEAAILQKLEENYARDWNAR